MKQPKPLHTGDVIRLINPRHIEPTGACVVIADQRGPLVWFIAHTGGAAFVARRDTVKVIRQFRPDGAPSRSAQTSHGQPDREVTP